MTSRFECHSCGFTCFTQQHFNEHLRRRHSSVSQEVSLENVRVLIEWFRKHGHTAAMALLHAEQCGANRGPEQYGEAYNELREFLGRF